MRNAVRAIVRFGQSESIIIREREFMGEGKAAAVILALVAFFSISLFSVSFAQEYCAQPPTVRSYVDATRGQEDISIFVYNEALDDDGQLQRVGVPNGLLVIMTEVADESGRTYSACKMRTGSGADAGGVEFSYTPPPQDISSRKNFYFTFCPVANDADVLSECAAVPKCAIEGQETESCNDVHLWVDNVGYTPNNPWRDNRIPTCSGSNSAPASFPQMLPSQEQVYVENKIAPDAAQLCWPLMLIGGLLVGGMFAAGKNPFGAFDFSSPRLSRGKQYQMRAQSKSFDVVSMAFAAVNVSSLSLSGEKNVGTTTGEEGAYVFDANKKKVGVVGENGKVYKVNAAGEKTDTVITNVTVGQVVTDANGKIIGWVQGENIVNSKWENIGRVKDWKIFATGGTTDTEIDGAALKTQAYRGGSSLLYLHSENRLWNVASWLGRNTVGRGGKLAWGGVKKIAKSVFGGNANENAAASGTLAAVQPDQGRVQQRMVGSAVGLNLVHARVRRNQGGVGVDVGAAAQGSQVS